MAILDIFRNRKEKAKRAAKEKKATEPNVIQPKKEQPKEVVKKPVSSAGGRDKGIFYNQVKVPHISEKSTDMGIENKYAFNVYSTASKTEIKKEIEVLYGVNVLAVNVINIHSKKRKTGRNSGFKKGYKKAIITIRAGQKIEII